MKLGPIEVEIPTLKDTNETMTLGNSQFPTQDQFELGHEFEHVPKWKPAGDTQLPSGVLGQEDAERAGKATRGPSATRLQNQAKQGNKRLLTAKPKVCAPTHKPSSVWGPWLHSE